MQASPVRDTAVGIFVLAGLLALAYLSVQVGGLSYTGPGGLRLVATFDEIGGLKERAAVVVAGVKVGQVEKITLNEYLRARVVLDLDPTVEIPVDSSVAIRTSGLLGDQYLSIEPGAELESLQSGEEFAFVENAISLERLIGKFVHDADLDGGD